MWFVFTTALVWHMFSVSFTSIQPWLFKNWFTEDVEGFQNHRLHILTLFYFLFPWLFLRFLLHVFIHAYHFPTFAFNHKHLDQTDVSSFSELDTKRQIHRKKRKTKKKRSQINPAAAETAPSELWWFNLSPASSGAKHCGVSQCSLQNQHER